MATDGNCGSRHRFVLELEMRGLRQTCASCWRGHSEERRHAVYEHTKLATLHAAVKKLPIGT